MNKKSKLVFIIIATIIMLMGVLMVRVEASNPSKPIIKSNHISTEDTNIFFFVKSIDKDNHKISYVIDRWGDGQGKYCTVKMYNSGEWACLSHTYTEKGVYLIRIGAVDEHGSLSSYRWFILFVI